MTQEYHSLQVADIRVPHSIISQLQARSTKKQKRKTTHEAAQINWQIRFSILFFVHALQTRIQLGLCFCRCRRHPKSIISLLLLFTNAELINTNIAVSFHLNARKKPFRYTMANTGKARALIERIV